MKYFWISAGLIVLLLIGAFVFRGNKPPLEKGRSLPAVQDQATSGEPSQAAPGVQAGPASAGEAGVSEPLSRARVVFSNKGEVTAEVVEKEKFRRRGLANRPGLGVDRGMLFLFEERAAHAFWMRGMRFSLDIIWIDGDRVVDIKTNLPAPSPSIPDAQLPVFTPRAPATMVLEVNAGWSQRHNLAVGDMVQVIMNDQ